MSVQMPLFSFVNNTLNIWAHRYLDETTCQTGKLVFSFKGFMLYNKLVYRISIPCGIFVEYDDYDKFKHDLELMIHLFVKK